MHLAGRSREQDQNFSTDLSPFNFRNPKGGLTPTHYMGNFISMYKNRKWVKGVSCTVMDGK